MNIFKRLWNYLFGVEPETEHYDIVQPPIVPEKEREKILKPIKQNTLTFKKEQPIGKLIKHRGKLYRIKRKLNSNVRDKFKYHIELI